jgi:micrococcal nuclease
VGRLIPFRRRRWTRSRDYGGPKPLRFWPEDRNEITLRGLVRDTFRWLQILRPAILLGILIVAWPSLDPALIEPPKFLSTDPEHVAEQFTRCGLGRGHACVIDGDTFKLGGRSVRIIGIDAPETHPSRCAEEARLGEAATVKLQGLLNEGSFQMSAPIYGTKDRYGRDLRVIERSLPNGSTQSIASDLRASGLARRYFGGLRAGWC